MKRSLLAASAALSLAAAIPALTNCTNRMNIKTLPYPETRMDEVTDDYHGTVVADPYRWLEDDNSPETAQWVKAQNEVTFDYIGQIPYRDKVRDRLTELHDYPKQGVPEQSGGYYYFMRNDGLQNQAVMYRQRSLDGEPELFFDPNGLSEDGTTALNSMSFSEDGRYLGYGVSVAGSDWVELRVMDTETGQDLPDRIQWVKFSSARWDKAGNGFYYSRYDEPTPGSELSGQNQFQKVYYHKLGDPQSEDLLVYYDAAHPLRYFRPRESNDGKYIFINSSEGTHGSEILVRETARPKDKFRVLFPGFEYDYGVVAVIDDWAYVVTNNGAPNFRLAKADLRATNPVLTDVIPETDDLLLSVSNVGGYFIATYLEHAQSAVRQFDHQGNLIRNVALEGIGTAGGFSGKDDATETFYSLSSFTSPAIIYRYDLATGESTVIGEPELTFDQSLYTSEQVFFTSKDGTRVPMFLVHRKDIRLDGNNPLLLYGYGGFNIPLTPGFNPSSMVFIEQGGIYVMVNLRGGSEYGEQWHRAGMLENKQNVFDDFISAAEWLIDNKYTSSDKIAIMGGSNGGLLVGACMTQRPELFAVAVPAVGVLDMLRYHKFTIGWGWVVEYGSSEDPGQFEYIYKYSPLHNISNGTCYPATLIMTGDHDDRVVPAHSFKFAAQLQKAQGCDKPTLIRIATNAGHGAGKPTSMKIEEDADMYSFIFWNTGTDVKY